MTLLSAQQCMIDRKICVLIPTYNNAKTLSRVLDGTLVYTSNIIVVNDGSTDGTADILKQYPQLHIIELPQNAGKGNALKIGFRAGLKLGYNQAITIDSDGQHYPDDLPVFLAALRLEPTDVLLIGNRNMEQEGIPSKSSFGNRFSNFWYFVETGIKLEDTQSGFRLYPLHPIPKKYYSSKFEFEIEIIVRAAWKGVPVKNIPIKVLYDPAERVSHFRPFRDFTRISILNTVLVFITFAYIVPRNFFNNFKKKSIKDFVREDIFQSQGSNRTKALSIALGTFVGLSPLWGLHTFLAIAIAAFFRLNKPLAFLFSNISIPPFIPFIIAASLLIGAPFVPGDSLFSSAQFDFDLIKNNLVQYLIGSIILASSMSLILGVGFYIFLNKVKPQNR